MAKRLMEMSIGLALLAMLYEPHFTSAQSSNCTAAIVSLAPCLSYFTGNPLASTPPMPCCSQLSSVVSNQAQCLCTLLNGGGSSFGLNINQTQALSLPAACGVKAPPVSICNAAAGGPASSPSQSPATPAASSTPSTKPSSAPTKPATPAGTGSKTTPSTTSHTSDGSSYKPTTSIMFAVLFIVASVSSLAVF